MGHKTKRIEWQRVEKWVKLLVYKQLDVVWWLRLHKTKRLHRFNFGLHRGAFRLHETDERFTHIGLHVYACGLFCWYMWKPFIHGSFGRTGALYVPRFGRHGNGIRIAFKCGLREGRQIDEKRVKMAIFEEWGYRWGYKVGLHFWKSGVTKLLPSPPPWGGSNNPKNGGLV